MSFDINILYEKISKITNTSNFHFYFPLSLCIFVGIITVINLHDIFFVNKNIYTDTFQFIELLTLFSLVLYIDLYKKYDNKIFYNYDELFYKNEDGKKMSEKFHEEVETLYNKFYKPILENNKLYKPTSKNNKLLKPEKLAEEYKKVYILDNILSKEQCNWLIYESEEYAKKNGWTTKRHIKYPTVDNSISKIDPISYFTMNLVYTKIIPYYEKYYNIDSKYLGIQDLFVVKYSTEKGMSELEYHEDGSEFSFVIALNDEFSGGGTRFININKDVNPAVGCCSIFCGKNTHSGIKITSGTRYIITGFLYMYNNLYYQKNP